MIKVDLRINVQILDDDAKTQTNQTTHYVLDNEAWQQIVKQLDNKADKFDKNTPRTHRLGDPTRLRGLH